MKSFTTAAANPTNTWARSETSKRLVRHTTTPLLTFTTSTPTATPVQSPVIANLLQISPTTASITTPITTNLSTTTSTTTVIGIGADGNNQILTDLVAGQEDLETFDQIIEI